VENSLTGSATVSFSKGLESFSK